MVTSSPNPKKVRLFTVTRELRRYGLRRSSIALWLLWLVCATALARYVPFGQGKDIFQYFTLHLAFLGFGATVFGFTILGGKDDFFEPIINSLPDGLDILRQMVLFLFFPLILPAAACGCLCVKVLFPDIYRVPWLHEVWRGVYSFFAIWAVYQTAMSFRFLFVLAITRLVWKGKEMKREKNLSQGKRRSRARWLPFNARR
jgi:hypothetical protein